MAKTENKYNEHLEALKRLRGLFPDVTIVTMTQPQVKSDGNPFTPNMRMRNPNGLDIVIIDHISLLSEN